MFDDGSYITLKIKSGKGKWGLQSCKIRCHDHDMARNTDNDNTANKEGRPPVWEAAFFMVYPYF